MHLVLCGLIERRFRNICRSHVDALHIYSGRGLRTRVRNALRRAVRLLDRAGKIVSIPPMETIANRLLGRSVSPFIIDYWQRYPRGAKRFCRGTRGAFPVEGRDR